MFLILAMGLGLTSCNLPLPMVCQPRRCLVFVLSNARWWVGNVFVLIVLLFTHPYVLLRAFCHSCWRHLKWGRTGERVFVNDLLSPGWFLLRRLWGPSRTHIISTASWSTICLEVCGNCIISIHTSIQFREKTAMTFILRRIFAFAEFIILWCICRTRFSFLDITNCYVDARFYFLSAVSCFELRGWEFHPLSFHLISRAKNCNLFRFCNLGRCSFIF